MALSAVRFYDETPTDQVKRYQRDLRFFHDLRMAVRQRMPRRSTTRTMSFASAKPWTRTRPRLRSRARRGQHLQRRGAGEIDKLETLPHADTIASHQADADRDDGPRSCALCQVLGADPGRSTPIARAHRRDHLSPDRHRLPAYGPAGPRRRPARLRPYRDAGASSASSPSLKVHGPDRTAPMGCRRALVDLAIGLSRSSRACGTRLGGQPRRPTRDETRDG